MLFSSNCEIATDVDECAYLGSQIPALHVLATSATRRAPEEVCSVSSLFHRSDPVLLK